MKEKFPDKNTEDSLEKELKYCKQLIDVVKGNEEICSYPKVQEKLNLLEESVIAMCVLYPKNEVSAVL